MNCLFSVFLFPYISIFQFQFHCSVGEQEDIQGLALETDCLPRYVAKGIALGCFIYGRCLHHGLGVEQNREQAKYWYSRVSMCMLSKFTAACSHSVYQDFSFAFS